VGRLALFADILRAVPQRIFIAAALPGTAELAEIEVSHDAPFAVVQAVNAKHIYCGIITAASRL
jgi:hypothetical protein